MMNPNQTTQTNNQRRTLCQLVPPVGLCIGAALLFSTDPAQQASGNDFLKWSEQGALAWFAIFFALGILGTAMG